VYQIVGSKYSTINSAIAEGTVQHAMSVEISVAYCYTSNANRSRVSLRSTFSNWHVLFRYQHSFVHASFTFCTASMPCRGCHQHTPVPPTLLMSTGP